MKLDFFDLFFYNLPELCAISGLAPDSFRYRRRVALLIWNHGLEDQINFPGKRRLERTVLLCTLTGCTYYAVLFTSLILYGRAHTQPISDAGSWLVLLSLLAGYLLLICAVRAALQLSRRRAEAIHSMLQPIMEKLQRFSPDQLDAAAELIINLPPYLDGAPVGPQDTLCCFACVRTFPAEPLDFSPECSVTCPFCGSEKYVLFGSEDAPAAEETLKTIHDLFIEE